MTHASFFQKIIRFLGIVTVIIPLIVITDGLPQHPDNDYYVSIRQLYPSSFQD